MASSRSDLVQSLLPLVREASVKILEIYAQDFAVDYKAPKDPVTEADRIANEYLCEHLEQLHPGIPVVAEESDPSRYASYTTAPEAFYVDPLDGTREFVARNDEFAIMVGFAEQGRATAGIVHAPTLSTTWLGATGSGAQRISSSGDTTPLRSSGIRDLSQARLLVSRTSSSGRMKQALELLGVGKVQAVGSAGLKGCYIAEGQAEVYLSPGKTGKLWDACAIDGVLSGAGAHLTDSYGNPIDYRSAELDNKRGLLAAYDPLHQQVLERLKQLRAEHRQ